MAQPCTRTPADNLSDALRELADAETAISNWRARLQELESDPQDAAHRAKLCAHAKNIAVNLIIDAGAHTQQACDAARD